MPAAVVRREDYFAAALSILSNDGYGRFKLAPVCKWLGVTTGSFYTHFASWGDFKTQFLRSWLDERTIRLVGIAESETDPVRRVRVLLKFAVALPHSGEAAIRAWSHSDPEVGAVQDRADEHRYSVSRKAIEEIVPDPELADRYTHLGMHILIGFQQGPLRADTDYLAWALEHLLQSMLFERDKSAD